ncbi:conserved hypothetical protein [Pediculus humanus corporis]|uniref:TLDc domain-containing protein n=1 Tax=Pediculus humanus subsp. corporis TaxID=121224 RepID=E0VH45_PEDHC|nr:uncharacterized protein Phum_PHUM200840 [Pediculus humanus corporis]EEB12701.1 conserved hypothetical protein [Pediculus humanus corporis]
MQKSVEEDSVQGITCRAFTSTLFPRYPDLSLRLFGYLHYSSGSTTVDRISQSAFKSQVDKLLSVISDESLIEVYVKMFAACNPEISRENYRDLIMTAYKLAMDHYPEGAQTCIKIYRTVQAVIDSTFHRKENVSVPFAAHWLGVHCPKLVSGVHKYVVHVLTTAYRTAGQNVTQTEQVGLELTTPVLDKSFTFTTSSSGDNSSVSLPLSQVWLLATSLPPLFTKPQQLTPSTSSNGITSQSSHLILVKMIGSVFPSHWVPLYNSNSQGLGANRFLTHVLNYRGATLVFLRGEGGVEFMLGSSSEWKESHQYRGEENCVIMQLLPEYHVIERGPKILYLNTSIRGYPKGIRAGSDPRKPAIVVNEDFNKVTYKEIPYHLISVEVWGCGKPEQREAQLEIKKWEIKEAEKQRVVKINAAEWVDHPDRYLLELAGRPVYNNTAS